MPRVASLYLPHFAIERLRAADARAAGKRPEPVERAAEAAPRSAATKGWRPGARWARSELADSREEVTAQIASLPAHRRPPLRELGRRSEAASPPFRPARADEGAALRQPVLEPPPAVPGTGPDGPRNDKNGVGARAWSGGKGVRQVKAGEDLLVRQIVREFATMPDRGRWDRDAGSETKRTTTRIAGDYDLEGAFWQSPHAIAGEIRDGLGAQERWADPAAFEARAGGGGAARDRGERSAQRGAGPDRRLREDAKADRPLVTVAREGQRIVVAATCPAARAAGLAAGMALTFARALVPDLDVRDADPAGDGAALHGLAIRAARAWSPVAAIDGEDGLWLDMSVAPLFGGEARMAARLRRWLTRRGFSARIAVAGTPGAAHALARHTHGPVTLCPPGKEAAALAPLPVAGLRLDGDAQATLHRLGIDRIGRLLPMPRAPLARRFGAALVARLDQATGARGEALDAVVPPERAAAACRFAEPIATAEAIAAALRRLMGELMSTLGARGCGARRLALVCRRVDGRDEVAAIGTARPTREAAHLLRLLEPKIETIDPGFGIEAMRLDALHTDPLGAIAISDLAAPPAPDLAPLVDLLAGRLGARRLYRLGGVESDVPERSVAACGPLGDAPAAHPRWPRPARLLDPPEAVDHVVAELPDQPPRRFSWRGSLHRIAAADGPERIYGEWWRRAGEAEAVRDYFQVEDEAGRRFWLYRRGDGTDPRTGDHSWHLHGLFG